MSDAKRFAPVRRVVTGHDEHGRAIFRSDEEFEPVIVSSGDAGMATIWSTATVPADNNDETDGRDRAVGTTLTGGSVIRIVDMLPGGQSPAHRTNSIDYGIVLSGTLELELDDGAVVTLGPTDIVVQRGTMHLWRNPSKTEVCRIAFVLVEAPPFKLNGQPLVEQKPHSV